MNIRNYHEYEENIKYLLIISKFYVYASDKFIFIYSLIIFIYIN